ncbi:probable protein phosphatase 2C 21 isoform X2 [Exaiptasia diaphana]|uniref:protein-serine/threonine phosphatase n=1 Tax=Exaiptasia diaphana TaxID=2652724 RepID=A0A913YB64_EXADI|nr:probable protein phosphatase 2C 21 isoform X2 [Exaiptasia diaphana]
MGAYLNKPKTEITSNDYSNDLMSCGASAMQGWRVSMEDAHTCLMDFDSRTALFGVFDGHGGSEVAIYAQKHLAEVLKTTDGYRSGNTKQGLIEAFFKLDEDLITEEGLTELKEIAGDKGEDSENENEAELLAEEANMPLIELLERLKSAAQNQIESGSDDEEEDQEHENGNDKDDDENHNQDESPSKESKENGNESDSAKNGETKEVEENDESDKEEEEEEEADKNEDNEKGNNVDDAQEEDEHNNDEPEDDSDDDDDEDDDDDDNCPLMKSDEVGYDSGTTAIVALVKDDTLTVANVGDSRCVVCRNGIALEMSIDHKPEDTKELSRIEKAGGKVTGEGRVNGGLNLSRALGDHSYKGRTELKAEEQQISAMPDIRQTQLTEADEFMVIACDGIWNVKNSQEVVDFVRKELKEQRLKDDKVNLSAICEKMFKECLAPDTSGDGSGCDNMSCLIVTFDSIKARLSGKRKSQDSSDNPNPDKKSRTSQD